MGALPEAVDLQKTITAALGQEKRGGGSDQAQGGLPPRAVLYFEDGSASAPYDLICFADGTHSRARRILLEQAEGLSDADVSNHGG